MPGWRVLSSLNPTRAELDWDAAVLRAEFLGTSFPDEHTVLLRVARGDIETTVLLDVVRRVVVSAQG